MILALLFHSFFLTFVEVIVVINIVKPFLKGDVTSIVEIMQGGWGADFATRFGGTKVQRLRFPGFLFVSLYFSFTGCDIRISGAIHNHCRGDLRALRPRL